MDECEHLVSNFALYEEQQPAARKHRLERLEDQKQQIFASEQQPINDNDFEVQQLTALVVEGEIMGQTESKKSGKNKAAGHVETKGTAMSFGFRKKLNTTPKKLKKLMEGDTKRNKQKQQQQQQLHQQQHKPDNCNNPRDSVELDETETEGEGDCDVHGESEITGNSVVADRTGAVLDATAMMEGGRDSNGNAAYLPKVHFEKVGAAGQKQGLRNLSAAVTPPATAATTTAGTTAAATGTATATTAPAFATNIYGSGVINRFGYRGCNVGRPASTGTTTRHRAGLDDNNSSNNNNNNNIISGSSSNNNNNQFYQSAGGGGGQPTKGALVSNLKRRSKSANTTSGDGEHHSGGPCEGQGPATKATHPKTITFNLNQNSTIEYQRRQFFEQPSTGACGRAAYIGAFSTGRYQHGQQNQPNIINTGMHTNVIVRPTPRTPAVAYSKFTLQTVSLPKPEFAVEISLTATTPTTPGGGTFLVSPSSSPSPMALAGMGGGVTVPASCQVSAAMANAIRAKNSLTRQSAGEPAKQPLHAPQNPQQQSMDAKTAKHVANSTRRGFNGSREISADSGIAGMDMALDSAASTHSAGRHASPKRSHSRPRNLQMVMNGRHKFEVRDVDDPPSSESSSGMEPLALPRLPSDQMVPLPLSGLVRSDTVLSRETYERKNTELKEAANAKPKPQQSQQQPQLARNLSDEGESSYEEKLYIDRSTSEKSAKEQRKPGDVNNTCSSKTSSPGSSIMSSWCNAAGESLAIKDCSSLTISSSEDSNRIQTHLSETQRNGADVSCDHETGRDKLAFNDDDLSAIMSTDMQISTISSLTDTAPVSATASTSTSASTLGSGSGSVSALGSVSGPRSVAVQASAPATIKTTVDGDKQAATRYELPTNWSDASADIDFEYKPQRPKSLLNMLNASKFAAMALEGSAILLDDETSPTDSLMSSSGSDDVGNKERKHKLNEELQEKDIDEISPELEVGSPISPGTPTHASHSLSLSDCGNLIDDEIADQPALLFNNDAQDGADSAASHKEKTDTPTLMETASVHSFKSQSRARSVLQQAIELSLRTPMALRKAVMERAESLDTLSPCESICSDDLMMDFEMNSSMDSIRSASNKSRSGSDLNKIDDVELYHELERQGGDVMKELGTILRVHTNRNAEKDSVTSHLPARATRLLHRSRLQPQCPVNNTGGAAGASGAGAVDSPDSSKSTRSLRRIGGKFSAPGASGSRLDPTGASTSQAAAAAATEEAADATGQAKANNPQGSVDDLMLYDKTFRNAMIQDVLLFKRQLLRLRRILQETETLNPFENNNGHLLATCGLNSRLLENIDLASLTSSLTDDPVQELNDLRRQVVYLQGQVEDRERTIQQQRQQIEKLQSEKKATGSSLEQQAQTHALACRREDILRECVNTATQTDRMRPLATSAAEGLSRLLRKWQRAIASDQADRPSQHFELMAATLTTKAHPPTRKIYPLLCTIYSRMLAKLSSWLAACNHYLDSMQRSFVPRARLHATILQLHGELWPDMRAIFFENSERMRLLNAQVAEWLAAQQTRRAHASTCHNSILLSSSQYLSASLLDLLHGTLRLFVFHG